MLLLFLNRFGQIFIYQQKLIKQVFYFYATALEPAVITVNVGGSRARLNKINVSTNLSFQAQTILQLKWRTVSTFWGLMHVNLAMVAWWFSKHISDTFSAITYPAITQSRLNLWSSYKWGRPPVIVKPESSHSLKFCHQKKVQRIVRFLQK